MSSVGLAAPTSDFTVSGSPVIDSGTLRLNWNTAPTSSNVPNAIVKRDASGGFSAGSIVAANGVTGRSSSGIAVFGESTGTSAGADGVHGVAHGPASGVTGVNTSANGVGVWGESPGWSFFANGDAHQERGNGGWVKAMVSVEALSPPYRIARCFNSALRGTAARTPPCGFTITEERLGVSFIDFGFHVEDRFVSATLTLLPDLGGADRIVAFKSPNFTTRVYVYTLGGNSNATFDLVVY